MMAPKSPRANSPVKGPKSTVDKVRFAKHQSKVRTSSPAKTPPTKAMPRALRPISSIFTFAGFAGTSRGSFFAAPGWVDESKPAGHTSQAPSYCKSPDWWLTAYTGYSLFFSPNLVWLAFALATYAIAPYDLEAAAQGFAWSWIAKRAAVNTALVFGYVGFWHSSLYLLGMGQRPFNAQRVYRWSKVAHNALYNLLASLQWTGWEVLVMRAWATGRLPYLTDADAFGTLAGGLNFVASFFWVPLWRSWHFYFAHRFLHVRPLYKYVHSLHHRNTDIEPFAGLCMHPVEHLYYFACAGPSLYVFASPFAFMWNGIHLLLSPAASHSGFEDNFQSDQFHYLHHKYFECNYGPSDCPLDRWFGTFKDRIEPKRASDAKQIATEHVAVVTDAKATLFGLPDASYVVYLLLAIVAPWSVLCRALLDQAANNALSDLGPHTVALLVGVWPVLAAILLQTITELKKVLAGPRQALTAPFHKEAVAGALGMHLIVATAFTMVPAYHAVHTCLAAPGASAFCVLRGGC